MACTTRRRRSPRSRARRRRFGVQVRRDEAHHDDVRQLNCRVRCFPEKLPIVAKSNLSERCSFSRRRFRNENTKTKETRQKHFNKFRRTGTHSENTENTSPTPRSSTNTRGRHDTRAQEQADADAAADEADKEEGNQKDGTNHRQATGGFCCSLVRGSPVWRWRWGGGPPRLRSPSRATNPRGPLKTPAPGTPVL